jgi:hypothetical protein
VNGTGAYGGSETVSYRILPRAVTLESASGSKDYDGKALTAPGVTVGGDGFVPGEATATAVGTITQPGQTANTIRVTEGTGFRAANYSIAKTEGTLTVRAASGAEVVVMYRLYNPNSGEHFYTAVASERDATVAAGWNYEGIGWYAPVSGKPVYRLYSGTDHHYTMDETEMRVLLDAGWKYEGVGWYSDEAEGVALYRQFNPYVDPTAARNNSGSHNYTTDKGENDALVRLGWKAEGIAWYGVKTS